VVTAVLVQRHRVEHPDQARAKHRHFMHEQTPASSKCLNIRIFQENSANNGEFQKRVLKGLKIARLTAVTLRATCPLYTAKRSTQDAKSASLCAFCVLHVFPRAPAMNFARVRILTCSSDPASFAAAQALFRLY
jgi:hypothetical protein